MAALSSMGKDFGWHPLGCLLLPTAPAFIIVWTTRYIRSNQSYWQRPILKQEIGAITVGTELAAASSRFLASHISQLGLALFMGTGLGLLGRPVLSRVYQNRRLQTARRRQMQYEQDRQLLGMAGGLQTQVRPRISSPWHGFQLM